MVPIRLCFIDSIVGPERYYAFTPLVSLPILELLYSVLESHYLYFLTGVNSILYEISRRYRLLFLIQHTIEKDFALWRLHTIDVLLEIFERLFFVF